MLDNPLGEKNMNARVKYICQYDVHKENTEKRRVFQSGINKVNTIIKTLQALDYGVDIISLSVSLGNGTASSRFLHFDSNATLKIFKSFGRGNLFRKMASYVWHRVQFLLYCFNNVKKTDKVIVYHTTECSRILYVLKKILGFYLIYEIEEIYADVNGNEKFRKQEYKLFNIADAYIFSTEKLDKLINISHKPSAIVYGPYELRERNYAEEWVERIHVVYAGTFEPSKGVLDAINAARYLNENYCIHILGNGLDSHVRRVKETIEDLSKTTQCEVVYEGEKVGEEFYSFMCSCDIGLSPQDPNALYNTTSFPSKVLTYISCGLRVVSIDIDTIKNSKVSNEIYFYHDQTPKEIAKTIMCVDLSREYKYQEIISDLQQDFKKQLKNLLEGEK